MRFFNVAALASLATGLCVWRDDFKVNEREIERIMKKRKYANNFTFLAK